MWYTLLDQKDKLRRFQPVLRLVQKFFPAPVQSMQIPLWPLSFLDDPKYDDQEQVKAFLESVESSHDSDRYHPVRKDLYFWLAHSQPLSGVDGTAVDQVGVDCTMGNMRADLLQYDLCYNPRRFDSWWSLAGVFQQVRNFYLFICDNS